MFMMALFIMIDLMVFVSVIDMRKFTWLGTYQEDVYFVQMHGKRSKKFSLVDIKNNYHIGEYLVGKSHGKETIFYHKSVHYSK